MNINSEYGKDNLAELVNYHNNKSLEKYGIACHWWNSETTTLHYHNFYEFFIVTSGEAVHEMNSKKQNLHKGMLVFVRPDDRHRIISSYVKKSAHINVSVTDRKLRNICQSIDVPFDELVNNFENTVNLSVEELDSFVRKAEKISLMYFNSDERYHILTAEILVDAIFKLYKRSISSDFDFPNEFNEILEKLHSPAYYDCTAEDVYSLVGFSPPVVIEMFKKYTNKTVVEYLRCIKMNKACELLENSNISIVEISNILGYASLSHFNTVFKKYAELTPAAYRKQKRKKSSNYHNTV